MKKNGKDTFDESDDNEEDWENNLEEEFKKGEEKEIVLKGLPLFRERKKKF